MTSIVSHSDFGEVLVQHCAIPGQTVLLCDIDGTLAPIVGDPKDAKVPDRALLALGHIAKRARLASAVTGRTLQEAIELVPISSLWIAAGHGTVIQSPLGDVDTDPAIAPAREQLDLAATMAQTVGWRYENKGSSVTIHFRHSQSPASTAQQMRLQFAMVLDPTVVEIVDARMALEVRPIGARTKAHAVRMLVSAARERDWATGLSTARQHSPHDGSALATDMRSGPGQLSVVMMGDDVTDIHALRALTDLGNNDASIKVLRVGVASDEMPDGLAQCVDVLVESPAAIESGLIKLADRWP